MSDPQTNNQRMMEPSGSGWSEVRIPGESQ